jgi:hypothetical protein
VGVTYHQANIHRLLHSPAEGVYQNTVGTVVRKTSAIAKVTVPVDTGRLKNGHVEQIVDEGSRLVGTVSNPTEYAMSVHQGHKEIVPVNGNVLVFRINGQLVYAKRVKATKGRPWLVNALKAASPWPVVVHKEPR